MQVGPYQVLLNGEPTRIIGKHHAVGESKHGIPTAKLETLVQGNLPESYWAVDVKDELSS